VNRIIAFSAVFFFSLAYAELILDELATSYRFEKPLHLRYLAGGTANAPAYVYTEKEGVEIPLGVFKREREDEIFAIERFTLLEKMKENGFVYLPNVIKNGNGDYLLKIDGVPYYCLEYLPADFHSSQNPISFSQMVKLIGSFHAYSQKLTAEKSFHSSKIDHFKKRMRFFSDPLLLESDPLLFDTPIWKQLISLRDYYSTVEFEKIYNGLPKQIIHGDAHPENMVISNNVPYFIDFDEMRFDIRLWDLACSILSKLFDEFLEQSKNGSLFSFLESNYEIEGVKLEDSEKKYLLTIVMFRQVEGMAWMLEMMKSAIVNQQPELYQQYKKYLSWGIYRMEKLIVLSNLILPPQSLPN